MMSFKGMKVGANIAPTSTADTKLKAWLAQRLGKITGSKFGDVTRLKTARGGKQKGDWTDTAMTYLYEILSERLTGLQANEFTSRATDWGIENEPKAIRHYEKLTGDKVKKAGFELLEGHLEIGCTVDGLINGKGVIEIKCPYNSKNHIKTMLTNEVPAEYWYQVLGHLLVTGREYCDFISFDPRMKLEAKKMHIIRIWRKDFIHELEELLQNVCDFETLLLESLGKLNTKKIKKK